MSNLKLTIDLLPKGAWENNLSKRLPKKDWDTLRNIAYEKTGHKCAVCGYKTDDLEAHEVWDFDIPSKIQTLKDIVALCPACHGVKHFRNSERIGYGEHAKSHFIKINGCSPMNFARHYTEAQILFEERNNILRWKLKANLAKFGGKGMEIKERFIPLIDNPYDGVDFVTVNHVKTARKALTAPDSDMQYTTLLLAYEETGDSGALAGEKGGPMYFSVQRDIGDDEPQSCPLPPKIRSIEVNNYEGTIAVNSNYTDKIQWMSGDKVIKTKYNVGGLFSTKFSVEGLKDSEIHFVLFGQGGATGSQSFGLREA